jgi:YgiT-type zinc finger domain-containing protein
MGTSTKKDKARIKCAICHNGQTGEGVTAVVLKRDQTVVIIKEVPAEICDNCVEYYLDDRASSNVLAVAEDAIRKGAEVEIPKFAA